MPLYEFACRACGLREDRLLPHDRVGDPAPCARCGAQVQRRFSRVGVRLEGWGFARNDRLVPDRPGGRGDWRELRDRAERIADPDG